MKHFLIYIALVTVVALAWAGSHFWELDREVYLSKKVLELSVPFDVKIDTEFLKSLEPANESSRTSPKGF